jgi:hypothetical protein
MSPTCVVLYPILPAPKLSILVHAKATAFSMDFAAWFSLK